MRNLIFTLLFFVTNAFSITNGRAFSDDQKKDFEFFYTLHVKNGKLGSATYIGNGMFLTADHNFSTDEYYFDMNDRMNPDLIAEDLPNRKKEKLHIALTNIYGEKVIERTTDYTFVGVNNSEFTRQYDTLRFFQKMDVRILKLDDKYKNLYKNFQKVKLNFSFDINSSNYDPNKIIAIGAGYDTAKEKIDRVQYGYIYLVKDSNFYPMEDGDLFLRSYYDPSVKGLSGVDSGDSGGPLIQFVKNADGSYEYQQIGVTCSNTVMDPETGKSSGKFVNLASFEVRRFFQSIP